MKSYHKVLQAAFSTPWAVQPEKLAAIQGFLELKLRGGMASPETLAQVRAASGAMQARAETVASAGAGSVAVLPLYGIILQRGSMDLSGPSCTSVVRFSQQLRQVVNDPSVKAVIIDVDSPGGTVAGVEELAQEIFSARKQKKITAVSNCLCASAAYFLASQCSEVLVSPSSQTGAIGVYVTHLDVSKADEMEGLKFTLISYGENKTEGNSHEPLSDKALAELQQLVDYYGLMFEKAVARGRGVKLEEVQQKFGQGLVFTAKDAVRLGLADRIGTLDDALSSYGISRGAARASLDGPRITASGRKTGLSAADPLGDWTTEEALMKANPNWAAASPAKADPQDGDGDVDCMCPCSPCAEDGDCAACSHEDCMCEGCTCDMAAKAHARAAEHERMRMQLEIAAA